MNQLNTDIFPDEHSYHQELLECVKKWLMNYIQTSLNISDSGLLRHNGGNILYHDELLELLDTEEANDHRSEKEKFKEDIRNIRECGIRSIRNGRTIVMG